MILNAIIMVCARPPHFFHLGGGGDKPLWGDLILYEGSNIFNTLSLFHLFRNSQHPEK